MKKTFTYLIASALALIVILTLRVGYRWLKIERRIELVAVLGEYHEGHVRYWSTTGKIVKKYLILWLSLSLVLWGGTDLYQVAGNHADLFTTVLRVIEGAYLMIFGIAWMLYAVGFFVPEGSDGH